MEFFIDADWTFGRDSRPWCSQGIVVAHVIRHRLCGHPYYPNGNFFSTFEVLAFDLGLERVMSDYLIWFDFRLKKSTRRLVANNKFFLLTPSSRKAYQTGTSKENTCPLSNTYSVDGQHSWLYDYPAGPSRTLSTGQAGDPKEIPPMPETSWNSLNTDWNVKQVLYYIDTMISINDESKSFWKWLVQIIEICKHRN